MQNRRGDRDAENPTDDLAASIGDERVEVVLVGAFGSGPKDGDQRVPLDIRGRGSSDPIELESCSVHLRSQRDDMDPIIGIGENERVRTPRELVGDLRWLDTDAQR